MSKKVTLELTEEQYNTLKSAKAIIDPTDSISLDKFILDLIMDTSRTYSTFLGQTPNMEDIMKKFDELKGAISSNISFEDYLGNLNNLFGQQNKKEEKPVETQKENQEQQPKTTKSTKKS